MATEVRQFPLRDVRKDELEDLCGGPVMAIQRIDGGLSNTIHRCVMVDGDILAVKHYSGGREWFEAELVTLTLLYGSLPVPEVVSVDEARQAIVYRWIDGITLNECRRSATPEAFATLAEPIGRTLAKIAATDSSEPYELSPILDEARRALAVGRARRRLGGPLSDTLSRLLDAHEPALAWGKVCLVHGDLGGRNLLVRRVEKDVYKIAGIIDWEACTTGGPLFDLGSMFRYSDRYPDAWIDRFADGYRAAGGTLPDDWLRMARLIDATWVVDTLDDEQELEDVFAECRALVVKLCRDL